MTAGPVTESRSDTRYPWVVMAIVLCGTYLVVLDTTVLGVALASIAEDLHAAESVGIDWVITSYLIAVGVVQPASAWLADRFGRKQVYMAALLAFTLSSLLAGVAPNLELLIGARLLQGLGGGLMMPVGMTMVWDQFPPHRRGMAMGIHGVAIMAAPAFGPVFGGYVVTSLSWRLLFLVNLPIGIVAFALAWRLLREDGQRADRRLDVKGWLLVSATVLVVVIGSREAGGWGWTSPRAIAVAVVAVVLGTVAVRWLRRVAHPLIELEMFGVPAFRLVIIMNCLMTASMYARVAFLPTELQVVRGMTAQRVGLLFMFGALAIAATMPIGGWLADRVGARPPVVIGQLGVVASLWALANLTPTTSEAELLLILVGGGLGIGLSVSAPQVVGMNALPPRLIGQASTMNSLSRQVAGAISTSVLAAVIVARIGAVAPPDGASRVAEVQSAYNAMFLVAFAASAITVLLALRLPGRAATRALRHPEPSVVEAAEAASGV